jgi:glycosyltransferase involved in cell wall biosynthesis
LRYGRPRLFSTLLPMRLGVYTDYPYVRERDGVYAERAFSLFLARLGAGVESLVLIGRLNPGGGRPRYRLPPGTRFVALPYYERLARPLPVARALFGSARRFWRALDGVDAVWVLGPHPLAIAFAAMATLRRRRVILGVRQDTPAYVRHRHPGSRVFEHLAGALDATYRALARRLPTVVVGPALRARYSGAPRLLELTVSLIEEADLVEPAAAMRRSYDDTLTVMSVGRLEEEKNPLLLADVLARLVDEDDRRWRLVVCGEGRLEAALSARLVELDVADRAEPRGYVQAGEPMNTLYRSSHFLLHTSWTEGLPQVLVEAFAAGLPVVAADVGGIRAAVGEAAVLVPPGEPEAAADALRRLAGDAEERGRLIEAGLAYARRHTIDREVGRLAAFLAEWGGAGRPSIGARDERPLAAD